MADQQKLGLASFHFAVGNTSSNNCLWKHRPLRKGKAYPQQRGFLRFPVLSTHRKTPLQNLIFTSFLRTARIPWDLKTKPAAFAVARQEEKEPRVSGQNPSAVSSGCRWPRMTGGSSAAQLVCCLEKSKGPQALKRCKMESLQLPGRQAGRR